MITTTPLRRFRVHAGHIDSHHAVLIEEASFEAAVVAFVEDHPAIGAADEDLRVIVHELGSGHEHCFMVDLSTGKASSCG